MVSKLLSFLNFQREKWDAQLTQSKLYRLLERSMTRQIPYLSWLLQNLWRWEIARWQLQTFWKGEKDREDEKETNRESASQSEVERND